MADPVKQTGTPKPPAVKPAPTPAEPKAAAPKAAAPKAAAPKAAAPKAASPVEGAPKAVATKTAAPKQAGKARLEPLNVNIGRCGVAQESALPYKKPAAKAAPKPAPGAKPAAGAKPVPGAKPVAAASTPKPAAPVAKAAPATPGKPPIKKAAPRAKKHYFILENLCVGCGLCLDKCPPKVNAIGYKFYGDVQEGGFRCYIDQNACISCSACFSADECPSGALLEVLPEGETLDFTYTPPERIDFDLRFLHRFHREVR